MKVNFTNIVIIAILIVWMLREGCHCMREKSLAKELTACLGNPVVTPQQSAAIHFDTITLRSVDTITRKVPQPYRIIKAKTDTLIEYLDRDVLIHEHLATALYNDSIATKYGKVFIRDTITRNRIAGRSVVTDFSVPEIIKTVTVTNTVEKPKRNQVFLGLNVQGNKDDYFTGIGPSILFNHKSGIAFEVGTMYTKAGIIQYEAGVKFKLSFTKN